MKKLLSVFLLLTCILVFSSCTAKEEDVLHMGVDAIITAIDPEEKILTVKDFPEGDTFGEESFLLCKDTELIYCNYDSHEVRDISFEDLQVGDAVILNIYESELSKLKSPDSGKTVKVQQVQLGTQRLN